MPPILTAVMPAYRPHPPYRLPSVRELLGRRNQPPGADELGAEGVSSLAVQEHEQATKREDGQRR